MPSINHVLQSKHSILKTKEAEELAKKFNISITQFPKIKITDPAIPDGASVGDLIKIERKDEAGNHVYYRVVII